MFDLHADKVVADAIIRLFESNSKIPDAITFDDTYWTSLTPETAFLARTCLEFSETCNNHERRETLREAFLPDVTLSFAFRLQENFNVLIDSIRAHAQHAFELDDEARQEYGRRLQ